MQISFPHIFKELNDNEFNDIALSIYKYQRENISVYSEYCNLLKNKKEPNNYREIPFLPISFFKTHTVVTEKAKVEKTFLSSGTTQETRSKHHVRSLALYKQSFCKGFEIFYGNPENYCFIALVPSYMENENSSLIHMIDFFIKKSKYIESGYYLGHNDNLKSVLTHLNKTKTPAILFGVTYALLDLAESSCLDLRNIIIMETGGMKGRRKELTKKEIHKTLKKFFGVQNIHSEYGMTELLSQAYSKGNNVFSCPPWMKILIRDAQDPFSWSSNAKTGGINVIDLANIYSCSFIETQDLGKIFDNGDFEIIGRFDNSDIRGCNLLTEL
ncbi:MAG: acyl transferase [Flavobacteriales bacterium]